MAKLKNKVGLKFGRLTVTARIPGRKNTTYLCHCSCGEVREVLGANLANGNTQSCGCLQQERTSVARQLRPFEASYNGFCYRAGKRGLLNDVSYEDFLKLTEQQNCHYCGEAVVWTSVNGNNKAYNLDRKDNTLGYLKTNVVVACKTCNRSKANRYSYEEWYCMTAALKILRNRQANAAGAQ